MFFLSLFYIPFLFIDIFRVNQLKVRNLKLMSGFRRKAAWNTEIITRDDVVSQRSKFPECTPFVFLGVKNCFVFLTFPYPLLVPKFCVIFIGCNFESRASQVGLHKQKKDTSSAKKGKVNLLRRWGQRLKECALRAQDLPSGDWKYCPGRPAGRHAGVGFLIYSQKARMSRIYYLRNRGSLGRFAA